MARVKNDKPIKVIITNEPKATLSSEIKKRALTFRESKQLIFQRKKLKPGLLKFWDTGQKFNDTTNLWENNTYYHDPVPAILPSPDPTHSGDQLITTNDFELSDMIEFNNTILSVGEENFEARFREILKFIGDAFSIVVVLIKVSGDLVYTYDSIEWTDQGLLINESDFFGAQLVVGTNVGIGASSYLVKQLDTRALYSKITNLPLYASLEVEYSPKGGDKIFLIPDILLSYGESIHSLGTYHSEVVYLNWINTMKPRDLSDPTQAWSGQGEVPPPGGTNASLSEAVTRHSLLPGHRTLTMDDLAVDYGSGYVDRLTLSNGGSFPVTYDPAPSVSFNPVGFGPPVTGDLTGIIKRNSQFFYVWRK